MKRAILGGILLLVIIGLGVRRDVRRQGPPLYDIPHGVGVVSIGNDMAVAPHKWWHLTNVRPNSQTLDDIASHGIRHAHVWVRVNPFDGAGTWCWRPFWPYSGYGPEMCTPSDDIMDEDMDLFWTHPDIDVIVVRFMAWSTLEERCDGTKGLVWEEEPTLGIVEALYEKYGDQEKVILIQNWEADWQLHGARCRERSDCVSYGWWSQGCLEEWTQDQCCDDLKLWRGNYLLGWFNERQRVISSERASRASTARLRVYHSISLNFYTDEWLTVARDIIPLMDEPPDFIGISFWKRTIPVTEALDYVKLYTHLPRSRIFISELGERERQVGDQYNRIYNRIMTEATAAFDWGVPMVYVWHWKYWGKNDKQSDLALFEPDNETPRSGYYAVKELNDE
jgi:hypothetical protein